MREVVVEEARAYEGNPSPPTNGLERARDSAWRA